MAGLLRRGIDVLSGEEIGTLALGTVVDSVVHMLGESLFDKFLETKYPEKYPLYSTGITSGILTAIGAGMYIIGTKKKEYVGLQYVGAGFLLSEVSSWLDMIRVNFEIGR